MLYALTYAEFVRFADSHIVVASSSPDIAVMAANNLPLLLHQGLTSVAVTG